MYTIATQLSCILVRTPREFSCLFNQSTKRVPPCLVFSRLFAREGRRTFHDAMHYASIPIEKLHYGILVKCFPHSPFYQCINFSDKIFGIQYLISFTFII